MTTPKKKTAAAAAGRFCSDGVVDNGAAKVQTIPNNGAIISFIMGFYSSSLRCS